jgi:RNA polymerase sigma factor (sigma-70 family)
MTDTIDHELLAEFVRTKSDTAFATLVAHYINLVYSTALRSTGNSHYAEEVTQAVFIILAHKAASLRRGTVLSGWLYQTARLTAANFVKGEIRRQHREQEAYMQSILTESDPAAWEQIAPLLDEAMGQLGETDRNVVVLRFFENKTAQEAGAALKLTEAATHKRLTRALDRLRLIFKKRGITLTATIIAGAVAANSVQAAPAALTGPVVATAVKGTLISATMATLVKGTMKTMTWLKLKFAIGMGVAGLLAGSAATIALSQIDNGGLTAQNIAEKSRDAYAALSGYSDSGTVITEIGNQKITTTFNLRLQRPNLYRIDWTQTGGLATTKGSVWSDGAGDYSLMADPMGMSAPGQSAKLKKMPNMKTTLTLAAGVSASSASTIPGAFFNQEAGDVFIAPVASGRHPLQKEPDAKVGDVDCYVVSSTLDFSKIPDNSGKPGTASTTLWIGKADFLIHQCRTKYVEKADASASDQAIDDAIKKSLEIQKKPVTPEAIAALRPQMAAIMKQVQASLKSSFESGVVFTQTHENIVLNPKLSPADFTVKPPTT